MSRPMPICRKVLQADSWSDEPVDVVTLDHDQRHRRRITMTGSGGLLVEFTIVGGEDTTVSQIEELSQASASAGSPLETLTAQLEVALIQEFPDEDLAQVNRLEDLAGLIRNAA